MLFAAISVLVSSTPSGATDRSVGTFDEPLLSASSDNTGVSTAISQSGQVADGQWTSSILDDCHFYPSLAPTEILEAWGSQSSAPAPSMLDDVSADTQRYTMIHCPEPVFDGSVFGFWPVGDPIPRPVVVFLGREAVARAEVPIPEPQGAPDGVDIAYLAQMPTWWWLDDTGWVTVTGTAALAQPASASVTATLTPIESVWQVEGYDPVVCGQGKQWIEGMVDADPERCGTVLETITGPGGVEQTVSVSYAVAFRCVPAVLCDQLPSFEPIVVANSTTVRVIQVRGVIVS